MIIAKHVLSVMCDNCGDVLETNAASPRIARDAAEKAGWKIRIRPFGESHYCPKCAEQITKVKELKEYYGG